MDEVLAKGVNFFYAKKFIEKELGRETWERIVQSIPGEEQALWSGSILASASYPFLKFKVMINALSKELGVKKEDQLARVYEYIADQSLSQIYKIFFRFANPSYVIKNYPKLWSNFFSAGHVEVPVSEKGHAVLKFIVPEIFIDWLSPACLGYSRKAVEMAGGTGTSMKQLGMKSIDQDSWEITYELHWNEPG
jgi:hypothetical protein